MTEPRSKLGDALREALPTYAAPDSLRTFARERAMAELASRAALRRAWPTRFAYAAAIVAAVAAGWGANSLNSRRIAAKEADTMVVAVVDTHVRSLMTHHLTDVISSDRHTVKPWFAGRVDFAPHVPDLAADGFPLIGGRVDTVARHSGAALVYGRRLHTIDLFVWPTSTAEAATMSESYHGFAVMHWTDRGLTYWAVSDVAREDLATFVANYRKSFSE